MTLPHLLQEDRFGRNLAGTFQMRAPEDVGIFVDARFHTAMSVPAMRARIDA
jgi:hypothetical protein